ncbi:MAG: hydroxymethylbilane synthase [Planctomycetaceae bacterium]|jgi:hydroxymethylbilane synthase|nr:hydroxymethylbilane synthase [Planctomycetaceae bacterium]
MHIKIGTRQSPLALWQANFIAEGLSKAGHDVELVKITTTGDTTTTPLGQAGGVGLFTKEIQNALLDGRCDVAVHSLKDLPTQPIEGLRLSAVPSREDPHDCLVSEKYKSVHELPSGCIVGTGSPRRRAQLMHLRSDLDIRDIRGNVDTRLSKLARGDYAAIVLASAGLSRLGLAQELATRLPLETMLPAVGQGALGLETRSEDTQTQQALLVLNDPIAESCVRAEREVLRLLKAGCLAPVGAHASIDQGMLMLKVRVFSTDGSIMVSTSVRHSIDLRMEQTADNTPEALARYATEKLIAQGADRLIASKLVDR